MISGTLFPANNSVIPTVTDNLYNNGDITSYMIGIYFQPSNVIESMNGEITWGQSPFPSSNKCPCSLFWFQAEPIPASSLGRSTLRMIPSILQNDSALTSDISPRTSASPAKFYWGIDQSVRYGYSTPILAKASGIVDTGSFPRVFCSPTKLNVEIHRHYSHLSCFRCLHILPTSHRCRSR